MKNSRNTTENENSKGTLTEKVLRMMNFFDGFEYGDTVIAMSYDAFTSNKEEILIGKDMKPYMHIDGYDYPVQVDPMMAGNTVALRGAEKGE